MKFGVQLWQEDFSFEGLRAAWREVEAMGYDSAWLYDHFYSMSYPTRKSIMDSWTLLPSLAAETRRLRLGVLVTCNSFRFPSVLAKVAASVDVMTGGRLEFAIGAGWYKEEYDAYGIPFPGAATRIEQLEEAVEVIKRIWTRDEASFHGKHYRIRNLISLPRPLQRPHPPLWIGGKGERMLLRVTARHADYANLASCSPEEYRRKLEALRIHCGQVGRRFEEIVKTWHGTVIVTGEGENLGRRVLQVKESQTNPDIRRTSLETYLSRVIAGTPEQCVEKIQRYADLGVTYLIPHFPHTGDLKPLQTFAEEVIPAFR